MSDKLLKRLIYDMTNTIQAHHLEGNSDVAALLNRATNAVSSEDWNEFLTNDHAQMIEAIRQDNICPYAA